jgi:hypothetical protein
VCRRPETDYRLQILHAARASAATSADVHTPPKEVKMESASNEKCPAEQKPPKQLKMMDVNTDEVSMVSDQEEAASKTACSTSIPSAQAETCNDQVQMLR